MTLGEKIRKYRILNGKTQRALGESVGFKKSTADVRINQYETDKMAPKSDIRGELANTLDIDIEALSDINISSEEELMHVFFELEERYGMNIEKKDDTFLLSFKDSHNIKTLITYLNIWYSKKRTLPENPTHEQLIEYELWKSKFVKNIRTYYSKKEEEIAIYYENAVKKATKSFTFAKTTSEITLLLRKLIESGISIIPVFGNEDNSIEGPGFTFIVKQLLDPPSEESKQLFARFLSELNHFAALGAGCFTDMQMNDETLTITYFINIPSFSVIQSQLASFINFKNSGNISDYSRESFEIQFKHDLETFYNDIEDEIKYYLGKM